MGEPDSEILFGRLLVEQGLARPEHVEECLRRREEMSSRGVEPLPRLGELLLKSGYLNLEQYHRTLRVSEATPSRREAPSPAADLPPEAAAAARDPANAFGKYVRVARLGAGGMGEVFRAWDRDLRRWVALKLLKGEAPDEMARFSREAQTAAKLNHPHIAAVHDVGQEGGRAYIAMQLVEGQTLATFPRDDPRRVVELMRDAAVAVHYAHEQGVVHRDLKPHNLMVEGRPRGDTPARDSRGTRRAEFRVYVMDFGLAKRTAVDSSLSISGQIVGTPAYMSPEQARGRGPEVGPRSDVYGLGATLFELLADRAPFQGGDVYDIIRRVVDEEPPPLRKLRPRVDPDLETIVARCLEKDISRRYATALEVAEDLQRYLDGEPIQARPASLAYRLRKRLRKHAALSAALGAVVLVLLAMGAYFVAAELGRSAAARALLAESDRAYVKKEWGRAIELLGQYLALRPDDARARAMKGRSEAALDEQRREVARQARAIAASELTRQATELVKEAKALWRVRASRREEWEQLFARAEEQAGAAAREYPDLAATHYTVGEIREAQGHWSEAVEAFDRALALDPALAPAWYRSGLCRLEMYYEEIVERMKKSKGLQQLFVRVLFSPGKVEPPQELVHLAEPLKRRAIADLRKYAELRGLQDEKSVEYRYAGIAAALAEWRFAEALEECDRLLREARTDERLWMLKMLAHLGRFQIGEALKTLDTVIDDVAPNLPRAWHARGWLKTLLGKWGEGKKDVERAVELDPKDAMAHLTLGYIKRHFGDLQGALEGYGRAIELRPGRAGPHWVRGEIRNQLGDRAGAIEDFSRAIDLDPKNPGPYIARADAREESGDGRGALEDYDRALDLEPKNAVTRSNRGRLKMIRGDWNGAMEDFDRALEMDPDGLILRWHRATLKSVLEDWKGALVDFNRLVELDPEKSKAYCGRAEARWNLKDLKGALEDCTRAIELDGQSLEAHLSRSCVRLMQGDAAGAAADFDKALELSADRADTCYRRARRRMDAGDAKGAVEDATRALALDPKSYAAYALRGTARWKLGDGEGAVADLTRAIDLKPDYPWAYFNRGEAKSVLKDWAGAAQDYSKAISMNPDNYWPFEKRGEARMRLGDFEGAAADFSRTIQLDPRNPKRWADRGRASLARKDYKAALADFRKAIDLDPRYGQAVAGSLAECERNLPRE